MIARVGDAEPWIAFAGGGTGGHLYPALAVAEELRDRLPRARLVFFVTQRAIDSRVLHDSGGMVIQQPVCPLDRRPWRWPGFASRWRASLRMCGALFEHHPPLAVIGSGGFASAPAVWAAQRRGLPTCLLNPDAVPGRANRLLARRATAVFVQWPRAATCFSASVPVRVTGCPVRRAVLGADRRAGVRRFGLDETKRTLLVTGASLGAHAVNEAVLAGAEALAAKGWQLLHLTGRADAGRVREEYQRRSIPGVVLEFTEHMGAALAAADLVLGRAGAATLAELTAVGKPSVLMPYPHHRDRQQYANARILVREGAARMISQGIDPAANAQALRDTLVPLLHDVGELERMASAAQRLGHPHAAAAVASEVLRHVTRHVVAAEAIA